MGKIFKKKTIALTVTLIIIFIAAGVYVFNLFISQALNLKPVPAASKIVIPSHEKALVDVMSFSGANGISALDITKSTVSVEQDRSGLVVTINGRKADSNKHEYWAFYINGKLAQVGPADYITKNSDTIQWKIEKY